MSFENFIVYFDNLSLYLVSTIVIAVMALIVSSLQPNRIGNILTKLQALTNFISAKQSQREEIEDSQTNEIRQNIETISAGVQILKQNALLNEIEAKMTREQHEEEQAAIKEQLSKIFDLLKSQEEKFKVNNMKDLEDQLKMYK